MDDSDTDPDFKVGLCEVRRCKKEVWAVCENCLILVCYDHCVEDITSCKDHGKTLQKRKRDKKRRQMKKNKNEEKGLLPRNLVCPVQVDESVEPITNHEGSETGVRDGKKGDSVAKRSKTVLRDGNGVESVESEGHGATMEESIADRAVEAEGHAMTQEENGREGGAEAEIDGAVVEDNERERDAENENHKDKDARECVLQPGEHNDEGATLQQRRGRKRQRNQDQWRRNVQKRLRDTGEAHISTTGKAKPARRMGPCCGHSCTYKCSSTFSHEVREKIFTNYWSNGDKREQRLFILKHVERHLAKRKRVGSDNRNVTFKYYLYTGDSRLQVCRHFFLNTLDVGRDFIYGTMDMHSATGTLKPTKQGAHSNHVKTDETLLKEVKDHISSFAVIDSHYCRAKSLKKYLDSSLSVSKMYKMYTEACRGPNKLFEFKYRQVFDMSFNLGFHRPKKDQCEICVAFRNTIDHSEKDKDTYTEH